ncbi:MAG TPA: hypothetical protein VF746_13270 [Longimicrobium sp.]|jgi:hypothetical protein
MPGSKPLHTYNQQGQLVESGTLSVPDEEVNRDAIEAGLRAMAITLRGYRNNTGGFTNVQRDQAIRDLSAVVLRLLRLQLAELSGTD